MRTPEKRRENKHLKLKRRTKIYTNNGQIISFGPLVPANGDTMDV